MDSLLKNIIIPPHLKGLFGFRAVSENSKTSAVSIFAASPDNKEEVCLLYLQVLPELQGNGLVQQLLQYAEQYLYRQGIRSIRVKCCGSQEKLELLYDFLTEEGFFPQLLMGSLLQYPLQSWLKSPFFQKTAGLREQLSSVITIPDWNDSRLQKFLQTHPEVCIPEECYDGRHCQFYLEKNQIQAILCAEQVSEKLLFLYNLYFSADCQKQIALTTLMAAFIQHAQRTLPFDTTLVLQNRISSLTHGLIDQFELPEKKYILQEYISPLTENVEEPSSHGFFFGRFTPTVSTEPAAAPSLLFPESDIIVQQCLSRTTALLPNTFLRNQNKISGWQKELNAWLQELGRNPIPMQRELLPQLFQKPRTTPKKNPPSIVADMLLPGAAHAAERESLHYFIFSDEPQVFAALLPKYLRNRFINNELIVIGGRNEKNEVLSYAVFSEQSTPKKTFLLEYIFVSKEHRRAHFGKDLLRFSAKIFAQIGSSGITAKQAGTAEQVAGLHDFLKKSGFLPVSMSARILAYSLSQLYHSEFMHLTESLKNDLPRVQHISDRGNFHLRRFAAEALKYNIPFDLMHFNTSYSQFFFRQGDIRSAVFTEQPAPNLLTITDSLFENNSAHVRIAMLDAIFNKAKHHMQEDATLVLRLDRSWNIQALQTLLGNGTAELKLFEYIMPL